MMFLHTAYESLGLPVYIVGLDSYEVLYINTEGKKLFGDIKGQKCYEVLNGTEDICEVCVSSLQLEEHGACHTKSWYLAAVGKHVDTYESLISLPDGSKGRLCLVVDITEQKQIRLENEARDEARKDMQHLIDIQSGFIESVKSMMSAATMDGAMIFANQTMSETLGFSQEEILHMRVRDFYSPEIAREFAENYISQALAEGSWKGDSLILKKDGTYLPVRQIVFPIRNKAGENIATAIIMDDITEQVKQEKESEAARRMLRTIFDAVPSAIFWKDRSSRFLGANRQFANDVGIGDPDKLIGMSDCDFYPQEIADMYIASDRKIFETGEEQLHIEEPFQGIDGVTHWVSTSKVPIRDENNEPYALLGIYDDITKLKQNKMNLEEAIKAAEEASRAKGDFLSRMSHEIRTPMNAIKGLAELLALTKLDSVQDSYVRNIVKSSNSLLSIINDVLDFSKINENKIELVEGYYLLGDLIAEVSNVVSLRAAEKGLMLLMEVSPSLPKGLIGDDVRVKQVIINILNNAVKYTPKGHVILRLFGEETAGGFELVCAVEDTGIGIRAEDIPFLFEAFSQADRRVNHNIQGTGLGLSISDRLIRSMGGSITVESEYGKGSMFTARFPQRIESREPLAAVENPGEKHVLLLERDVRARCATRMLDGLGVAYTAVTTEENLPHLTEGRYTHCIYDDSFSENNIRRVRGRTSDCVFIALKDMRYAMGQSELHDAVLFIPLLITELVKALAMVPGRHGQGSSAGKAIDDFVLADTHVLVVDDNEINLIVSGEILRAYKAEVTCAESGQNALDLCAEKQFDLIFMDHMMPEMDGVETTIALRGGDSPNKATPVIALTANVVNDMASYYLQSGMDDFISKPIEMEDLHRVLLKWLPGSKITTMEMALQPEAPTPGQTQENSMERLIQSLDAFGMYVSDVMREIGNDYDVYIRRMDRIRTDLAPLVARLRDEVRMESWDDFAADIGEMGSMIHDVGARDCSGRARKLSNAARARNADYVRGDFFSLMDNMYMLEKKMEVAVPLALGSISPDVPFGDLSYCYDRLMDMNDTLSNGDYETSAALLDSLAHYSLDHALDLILVGIGARLSAHDFSGASDLHTQAVQHCAKLLDGHGA